MRRLAIALVLSATFGSPGCKKKQEDLAKTPTGHKPDAADTECAQRCGSADECYAAGYAALYGNEPARDEAKAAPCLRRACELGHADACRGLAGMFEFGQGIESDRRRAQQFWASAVKLHRERCDDGGVRDCFELGILMFRGQGTAQDRADATRLFRQACDSGNANGCVELKLVCSGSEFPACF